MYGNSVTTSPRFPPCALFSAVHDGKPENPQLQTQVKVAVGPVGNVVDQSFPIARKLGPSSTLVVVSLPKPMGIIFEPSKSVKGHIVIAELVRDGRADRADKIDRLFVNRKRSPGRIIYGGSAKVGDLLLATTTVNVIVDFFGLRAPRRVISLFDVEGSTWSETMAAINASFVADGPVTLILEREYI